MTTPPAPGPIDLDELGDAIESMTAHIAVLETDGRIRAVNKAWRRFAAENASPISPLGDAGIGANYLAVCDEAAETGACVEAAAVAAGIRDILTGRKDRFEHEYPCRGPAGMRWFNLVATPLRGGRGAVVAHHDITDRKRAELTLVGQNEVLARIATGARFEDALEAVVHLVETQLPGTVCWILRCDPATSSLRYTAGKSVPRSFSEHFQEVPIAPTAGACGRAAFLKQSVHSPDIETDPHWARHRDLALAHGFLSCFSVPMFAPGEGPREVLGTFALFRREKGPPDERALESLRGAAGLAAVVIERERAALTLRESEERYRRLVDVLPVAVFLQSDYAITFCNRAFVRLAALPDAGAAIGKSPLSFFPPEHHGIIRSRIQTLLETSTPAPIREETLIRADGERLCVQVVATSITDRGRTSILVALLDVTERKRLEEQYRQSQKMEAIGQLAGGVAHDFNNLLTIITGYTETLREDLPAASPHQESVAAVLEAAQRAASLTAQLLAFSRKALVEPRILDLHEVIPSFARMLRRMIGEDVQLVLDLAPSSSRVNIDPGQMEQVLLNLAVNARDAMPTGGRLTITTRDVTVTEETASLHVGARPGPHVLLTVADTGYGMTTNVMSHVFEPFFTTKGPGRGTGLGLATLYGIVRQAGGFVTVESEVGRGATFRVHLPVAQRGPSEAPSPAPASPARGSETILLVEDEDAVRRLVQRVLLAQGYTVIPAASGDEALRRAAAHRGPIHLLLTDVVMPDMGGRVLAEAIRTERRSTRTLYMSGYTDDAIVRHGIETARDTLLQKPFTPAALTRKVRDLLDAPDDATQG